MSKNILILEDDNDDEELTPEFIAELNAVNYDLESGKLAPARVIKYVKDADGKLTRTEVDPEETRRHAAEVWEAKNEVARLRSRLDLSQEAFAKRLSISVSTLRKWESNAAQPSGAAASLLKIVSAKPEVLDLLEPSAA